ncbi:hypothetical protein LJC26_04010 [Desulfovibrio sp. OttesenSCG-928-O18]|nr:hypothetical protein [Desulfovibrio sp. OttesenSCG-928-O18]
MRRTLLDVKGKGFGAGLMVFCAGTLAVIVTAAIILAVDWILPVGSTESQATLFIRIAFLVPLAYFAAYLAGTLLGAIIGSRYPVAAITNIALFAVTVTVLAPIAKQWIDMLAAA